MHISFYNENSAKNALKIYINGVNFYFSYNTLVGVKYYDEKLKTTIIAVRQNQWGPTTGKHLNWIDGGDTATRMPSDIFQMHVSTAMDISKVSELPYINIL